MQNPGRLCCAHLLVLGLLTLLGCRGKVYVLGDGLEPPPDTLQPGAACVPCEGGVCIAPRMDVDASRGLVPQVPPGLPTFDPEDFTGTDLQRVQQAIHAAEAVSGAVVMHRIYETDRTLLISQPITFTGGGLRRTCSPLAEVATTATVGTTCFAVDSSDGFDVGDRILATRGPGFFDHVADLAVESVSVGQLCTSPLEDELPAGTQLFVQSTLLKVRGGVDGVTVDAVFFDGANRCNDYTHDWRFNNALIIRGDNTVTGAVFYDSPSESITSCGGHILNSRGFELQGSLVHKSCATSPEPRDVIEGNYVDGANLAGNELLKHSEGLITLSANAGNIFSSNNNYRGGHEGVFGLATPEDDDIVAVGDCYERFSHVIRMSPGMSEVGYDFDATLIQVPVVFSHPFP